MLAENITGQSYWISQNYCAVFQTLLTEDSVLVGDSEGKTVMHAAAEMGEISYFVDLHFIWPLSPLHVYLIFWMIFPKMSSATEITNKQFHQLKPVVTCESRMREPVSISSALQSQNAVPYIPVYNAMFFLSYSCHKKAPRIIHRCRI